MCVRLPIYIIRGCILEDIYNYRTYILRRREGGHLDCVRCSVPSLGDQHRKMDCGESVGKSRGRGRTVMEQGLELGQRLGQGMS